jgi:hypothetical protein
MARHFTTDLVDYRAPFVDADLAHLHAEYGRSPAELTCPHCRPGAMEIIGFVEPEPDGKGFAIPAEPLGTYVVLLRCVDCRRGGSLLVDDAA